MLAAYLTRPGTIVIEEQRVPDPSRGEILVRVRSALTCGTDLKAYIRGHDLIPMPGPFGHEFSGIVAKTGPGIRKFREGDQIMAVHSAPCRACSYCKRGSYNLCENIMTTKVLGAFSEYILLPEHIVKQNVFQKPKELGFDEAAMLEPLACVVHPYELKRFSGIETALIIGAGPIGLLHLLLLKKNGVRVSVSDLSRKRLKTALNLGTDHAVGPDSIGSSMVKTTAGAGFDLVVECTGQPAVWERSVDFVRNGGTVVLFGGCKSGTTVSFDTGKLHYREITLLGSFHFTPSDVQKAYRLLAEGTLDVSPLITGKTTLRNIQSVFERLKKGAGIKYAINP